MLDRFLISERLKSGGCKFLTANRLKPNNNFSRSSGLNLYENQKSFVMNPRERWEHKFFHPCIFPKSLSEENYFNEQTQRLNIFPIDTRIDGLETLEFYSRLIILGNSVLDTIQNESKYGYFGIDFIPNDIQKIRCSKNPYDGMTSIDVPETYRGIPKILIPELVFYGGTFFEELFKK